MKKAIRGSLKIVFIIVIMLAILGTFVAFQKVNPVQQKREGGVYAFSDTLANNQYDLDSIIDIIGANKGLPKGFELAAAIAYSAYPELKGVEIDMILTQNGAPMESSFDILTMFGSKENRNYEILLNDSKGGFFDPILLRALPFDAQVGILAHELGHIVYYHRLNLLQIGKWALSYAIDKEFRADHERSTDLMPVYHGLGSQIYQYAYYIRHDSSTAALYEQAKEFIDQFYLTDEELLDEIEKGIESGIVRWN